MKWANITMLFLDWLAALLSWLTFFYVRKQWEQTEVEIAELFKDEKLILGLLIIPAVWLIIWNLAGMYNDVLRKSRIKTIYVTIAGSIIGCIGLLFTVLIDDQSLQFTSYLKPFLVVLAIHIVVFIIFRLFYLSSLKLLMNRGVIKLRGVLISDDQEDMFIPKPIEIFKKIEPTDIDLAANYEDVDDFVVGSIDYTRLQKIIPELIGRSGGRALRIHETSYNRLDYSYEGTPSLRYPIVTLSTSPLQIWQRNIKRCFDIVVSIIAIFFLSPLMCWLYIRVKKSSPGPVLYRQERIGMSGRTFNIIKFRSMYEHAEQEGPKLAQMDDKRCTPFGKWMRRWRLDELPQFLNVLKGEMSLVGPRPERGFYSDQLMQQNPLYALLWQVKPGITSWGQIKFGYASTIEEMMKRFKFDLLYLEKMSILLDLRILYYTLIVLFQGKGR